MDSHKHSQEVAEAIIRFLQKYNLPLTATPELLALIAMGFDEGSWAALEAAKEVFGVDVPSDPKLNN